MTTRPAAPAPAGLAAHELERPPDAQPPGGGAAVSGGADSVALLRVLLELDGPSAARVLGISGTACSTRLSRALKRLEEAMADVHG